MANILSSISKIYKKTNASLVQASLPVFCIALGALVVININQNKNSSTDNATTDNIYRTFSCQLTAEADIKTPDTTDLKTNKELSLINYDTEVFSTGMTKNYIPSVTSPKIVSLTSLSPCLGKDDLLIVVKIGNDVRAYSRRILEYHIAINDNLGDTPVLVTYSPLSDHYNVYNRTVKSEPLVFGVSGLLYKNTDLLFDSKTESLWSALTDKAVVGNMIGARLTEIPYEIMTYEDAVSKYPQISAVSFDTGSVRDYNEDPFISYAADDSEIIGKVTYYSESLPYKTQIVGFIVANQPYAYKLTDSTGSLNHELQLNDGSKVYLNMNDGQLESLMNSKEEKMNYDTMYWFVWYDLYPQTKLLTD